MDSIRSLVHRTILYMMSQSPNHSITNNTTNTTTPNTGSIATATNTNIIPNTITNNNTNTYNNTNTNILPNSMPNHVTHHNMVNLQVPNNVNLNIKSVLDPDSDKKQSATDNVNDSPFAVGKVEPSKIVKKSRSSTGGGPFPSFKPLSKMRNLKVNEIRCNDRYQTCVYILTTLLSHEAFDASVKISKSYGNAIKEIFSDPVFQSYNIPSPHDFKVKTASAIDAWKTYFHDVRLTAIDSDGPEGKVEHLELFELIQTISGDTLTDNVCAINPESEELSSATALDDTQDDAVDLATKDSKRKHDDTSESFLPKKRQSIDDDFPTIELALKKYADQIVSEMKTSMDNILAIVRDQQQALSSLLEFQQKEIELKKKEEERRSKEYELRIKDEASSKKKAAFKELHNLVEEFSDTTKKAMLLLAKKRAETIIEEAKLDIDAESLFENP